MVLANGRPPVRGRPAVEQAYRGAGGPLSLRALAYEREGSIAYIIGAFSAQEGEADGGKFILALRQDPDGVWRIAADMDNMNQTPRRAAPPNPGASPPSLLW